MFKSFTLISRKTVRHIFIRLISFGIKIHEHWAHKSDLSTQYRSVERVKRNAASPSDILRLLKQPVGPTRNAVRAADYMYNTIDLIKMSHGRRQKRSINATGVYPQVLWNLNTCMPIAAKLVADSLLLDLLTDEDLEVIAKLTGCSPQHRSPSCRTTPNLNKFRTASSVCNNGWGSCLTNT